MSKAETAGTSPAVERVLLVVVDDSDEMPIALHFACRRAEHTDGRVALLYLPDKADFQRWLAIWCGKRRARQARNYCNDILRKFSI